jgi:aminopeptidase 2
MLHALHNQTDFDEEKMRLAHALCSFSQESLIERSLGMITSDEVRKQEVRHWLAYLFSNPHAAQPAWRWMQDNWQWLDDNFRGSHAFPDFPKLAARSFADQDKAAELENFFRGTVPDRSLDQAIEHIHIQAAWYGRDSEAVGKLAES